MLVSLDDYLDVVAPQLPPELLPRAALEPIRRITRTLPPCSLIGFESALSGTDPSADFAVGLTRESAGSLAYARAARKTWRAFPEQNTPGWARLRDFLSVWADPAATLYGDAGTVWLEWDIDRAPGEVAVPNVLFGLTRDHTEQLADDGLRRLLGRPLSPATRIQLARCFNAVPPPARVFQVGAMLARQVDGLRLCIYPVRVAQAASFLARIGWPGAAEKLEDALAPFGSLPVNMALDVDIGAGVAPKIGFECYLDERRNADLDPRWAGFLERLVHEGICTPQKRAALLAWLGRETSTQFVWPRTFVRGLNHIKLVYMPGQPLTAKAYWGFTHVWSGARAGAAVHA